MTTSAGIWLRDMGSRKVVATRLSIVRMNCPEHSRRDHIAQAIDSAPELVAYRPPLFPMSLAALNTINGRQFWAVRVMNVLATAGTCGLLVWYLAKTQGRAATMIAFIMFLAVDTRTRLYGRAILTEATATFLTTIVTLLLLQLSSRMQIKTVLALGFVAGLLVLDRTVFVLWLPGIVVMIFLLTIRTSMQKPGETLRHHCRRAVAVAGCFLAMTILVVSPWAVRNVNVLDAMMPLGTQGMTQLPAGFSDHAVDRNGVWDMVPTNRLRKLVANDSRTRLEQDVARARLGRAESFDWIQNNFGRSIQLAGMKMWQEYRPRVRTEWLIGLSAAAGVLLTIRRPDTRLFLALHAVNCVAIGCTWSVEGRFVVPLMFSIHVLAAQSLAFPFRSREERNAATLGNAKTTA
jgi:4-amino-4-deoxy-L-arabinose transferase-like glycosyltransferase